MADLFAHVELNQLR